MVGFNGTCYILADTSDMTFMESQAYCRDTFDGDLVTINTAAEHDAIKYLIRSKALSFLAPMWLAPCRGRWASASQWSCELSRLELSCSM